MPDAGGANLRPLMELKTIVVLEGDQTGQELLEEALRVIAPDVIGVEVELPRFDLSLESRRATQNAVVHEAARAIRAAGLGLKAATVTPEARGDVGSPNRILREEIGGKVIVRTGRRIPGIVPFGGVHAPISVVRMAVGDAYGAKEWREGSGDGEVAFRTERIERTVCRAVAEFAFRQAEHTNAKVFGGPKFTVSPTYEGMLKEEMDAAAARHPDVPYEPQLIDATFALLVASSGDPLVIPALNRDGDILSDLVLPLFGSIAGSESMLVAFEGDDLEPTALMAEAAHGPRGQERREPDGDEPRGRRAAHADRRRAGSRGRARDPRVGARGRCAGREDGRPRRARGDLGVHRRGDPPHAHEARGLVDALGAFGTNARRP
jgi:isocitrate dehydrogenase (NAD+)